MNVVTCYEAAKIARVSKQIMSIRKKVNADNKSKYKYFAFDSVSGEFGVDIDHIDWKRYMTKRQSTPAFKNEQSKSIESQSNVNENDNYVHKTNILTAMKISIQETNKFNKDELNGLLSRISRKYTELEGRN